MRSGRMATIGLIGGLSLAAAGMWAAQSRAEDTGPASSPGVGQQEHGSRPFVQFLRNRFKHLGELRSQLGVTDEQKQQIRDTLKDHKAEIIPMLKEIQRKRAALRKAVLAEQPSEQAIRSAADDLGKSIGDAAVKASAIAKELKTTLTAEQLELLKKFRQDRETEVGQFLDKALTE